MCSSVRSRASKSYLIRNKPNDNCADWDISSSDRLGATTTLLYATHRFHRAVRNRISVNLHRPCVGGSTPGSYKQAPKNHRSRGMASTAAPATETERERGIHFGLGDAASGGNHKPRPRLAHGVVGSGQAASHRREVGGAEGNRAASRAMVRNPNDLGKKTRGNDHG